MITFIRNWLQDRARARHQALYASGFDYVAGCLLQGVGVDAMADEIDALTAVDDDDSFYVGAVSALNSWTTRFGGAEPALTPDFTMITCECYRTDEDY